MQLDNVQDPTQLKNIYYAKAREAADKSQRLNQLEQQKKQLLSKGQQLQQVKQIDSQINYLDQQIKAWGNIALSLKNQHQALSQDLTNVDQQIDNLHPFLQSTKQEVDEYQKSLGQIKQILQQYSVNSGYRLDESDMVLKAVPKDDLLNSKLVMQASKDHNKQLFQKIAAQLSDINQKDGEGKTLLHHAIKHCFWEGIKYLLEFEKLDVDIIDHNGRTPLMYFMSTGYLTLADKLIAKSNNLGQTDYTGKNVMHYLCQKGGAKIFISEFPASKINGCALHLAGGNIISDISCIIGGILTERVSDGYSLNAEKIVDLAKILYKYGGMDLYTKDANNISPIKYAVLNGKRYFANEINKIQKIDFDKADDTRCVEILVAALNDDTTTAKQIIAKHPNVLKDFDVSGYQPLHWTIGYNSPQPFKLLAKLGADINSLSQDASKLPPLYRACAYKHGTLVKDILALNPDLTIKTPSGQGALSILAELHDTSILSQILSKGANINEQDNAGCTLLYKMVQYDWQDMVEFCLQNKANPNLAMNIGSAPLHMAVSKENSNIFDMLLKYGANLSAQINNSYHIIHAAMHNKGNEMLDKLLALGVNINQEASNGMTPAYYYTILSGGKTEKLEYLIHKGAKLLDANSVLGRSLLHGAVSGNNVELVNHLAKKIPVDVQDNKQLTPLYLATQIKNNYQIIDTLLQNSADPNKKVINDCTPLLSAFTFSKLPVIELLIKYGGKYIGPDLDNDTYLHGACQNGDMAVIKKAIELGAGSWQSANTSGQTPIFNVINNDKITENAKMEIFKQFKDEIDLKHQDNSGKTIMDYASSNCPDLLTYLEFYGNDIDLTPQLADMALNDQMSENNIELIGDNNLTGDVADSL